MSEKIIIGLTGPTGAGKSTIGMLLRKQGFAIIDADKTARQVTEAGSPTLAALCDAFGEDILNEDGSLIRPTLAERAFADKESLEKLNSITHPAIVELIEKEIASLAESGNDKIIIDAPQLFEAGADKLCTFILSVLSDRETRIERITCRDSITAEQALARIEAQKPDEFFIDNSDFVIYNNSDTDALIPQLNELLGKLGCEPIAPDEEQGDINMFPLIEEAPVKRSPWLVACIALVLVAAICTAVTIALFNRGYSKVIAKSVAVFQDPSVETIEDLYPQQVWDLLVKRYSAINPEITTTEAVIETYLLEGTNEIVGMMNDDFGEGWALTYDLISSETLKDEMLEEISTDLQSTTGQKVKISKAYTVSIYYTIEGTQTVDGSLSFTAAKINGDWYAVKKYAEVGWKLAILEF